jgi:hypothetical protein
MPFDGTNTTDATIALARFREAPTLADLAIILRHREVWPEGFVWDYSTCQTCAMGLAEQLGVRCKAARWPTTQDMAVAFTIPRAVALYFFIHGGGHVGRITPARVAAAIERHLAAR